MPALPVRIAARRLRALRVGACALGLLGLWSGCRKAPPRLPQAGEVSPEVVVVNYAPRRLRVVPQPAPEAGRAPGYVLLASERPELPAVFRPLGVTEQTAPAGYVARAGELAWAAGHVVESPPPAPPLAPRSELSLLVYDRDGKVGTPRPVALPAPCTQDAPALLASDGGPQVTALLRCPAEQRGVLLRLAADGALLGAQLLSGEAGQVAARAALFLHHKDADYLAAGPSLVRVGPADAPPRTARLPGVTEAASEAETRELLSGGVSLLFVDAAAGRLLTIAPDTLELRATQRFAKASRVQRARAALVGLRLVLVVAEHDAAGTALWGQSFGLDAAASASARVLLGTGPPASDHELVPYSGGGGGAGALLVRTHAGNSGPLVALSRLTF